MLVVVTLAFIAAAFAAAIFAGFLGALFGIGGRNDHRPIPNRLHGDPNS